MGNIMEEAFTAYTGSEKVFTLNGKELVIPARFDAFITYRTKFMKLAKACADKAAEVYKEKIHDLDTFRALFQDIYLENLKIVSSKAVDILVSEGIYQFSIDTFSAKNIETFHTALNDLRTTNESVKLTEQNNAKVTQNLKNGIGSLFSNRGSFARGLVQGAVESTLEGSEITAPQKAELYQRIRTHLLLHNVFQDYWNAVITLVGILRENGKDIWLADSGKIDDINAVLESVHNPNFPQEKVADVLFDCILKKPNAAAIYKTIEEKFGLTDEVQKIFDYFIYPDFTKIVYTESDFPGMVPANSNMAQGQNASEEPKKKKGLFSFMDKESGESVKKGLKIGAGLLATSVLLAASKGGSTNNNSNNNDGKKDYYLSSGCKRARLGARDGCVGCTLAPYCSHCR